MTTKLPQAPATAETPAKLLRRPILTCRSGPAYPTIEDITRRQFLIGAGSLLVLAPYGCGSDDGAGGETTGGTRTVEHAFGSTEVPNEARRVAVLDTWSLDNSVALEAPVVAAKQFDGFAPFYRELRPEAAENVGSFPGETNLEALAATEPDLVLCDAYRFDQDQNQLTEIAPTVPITPPEGDPDWKETLRLAGKALGRQDLAEEKLADYGGRVKDIRAALGGAEGAEKIEVSIVLPRSDGQVRIYLPGSFGGQIIEEVGLSRPPSQREDSINVDLSLEQVGRADADAIFFWTGTPEESQAEERLKNDPLWQKLGAVEAGRVYDVGGYWYGFGPTTANRILDDIERYLVGGEDTAGGENS